MTVQVTLDSKKSSSSHPGKGQTGTGRAAHPPLAHILPPSAHTVLSRWGHRDSCSLLPRDSRGPGASLELTESHCMPELSRNRNHGERLKCGNRRALDSSPHRFSKLVQPDVSSCWSTEQQRSLSPCCGRVSRTPGPGQAHSPHSYGWDVLCSAPHSTGAAGSGTDVSLPQFQVALQHQQIRHSSTWHRRKLRQEASAHP